MKPFDKNKALAHFARPEEREALRRLIDLAESCATQFEPRVSDFYDPHLLALAPGVLNSFRDVNFRAFGGWQDAERKRWVLTPDYLEPDEAYANYLWLRATGDFRKVKVGHRDFLGSLLGLGVKREKFGDLCLLPQGCALVVDADLVSFVESYWQQVHQVEIHVERLPEGSIPEIPRLGQEQVITVASMRIDAVIASIWNLSRGQAQEAIASGKLRVNWLEAIRGDRQLVEGDVLSLRGKGRAKLQEVSGLTKKGRLRLVVYKPIDIVHGQPVSSGTEE